MYLVELGEDGQVGLWKRRRVLLHHRVAGARNVWPSADSFVFEERGLRLYYYTIPPGRDQQGQQDDVYS